MSDALQSVCTALSLDGRRRSCKGCAQKIIEMAQRGVRGADVLHSLALQEFQSE